MSRFVPPSPQEMEAAKVTYLRSFMAGLDTTTCLTAAGINRTMLRMFLEVDPQFARAYQTALNRLAAPPQTTRPQPVSRAAAAPARAGTVRRNSTDSQAIERFPLTAGRRGQCAHCRRQAEWIVRVGSSDWQVTCSEHYNAVIERLAR